LIGYSVKTLQRWDREGILRPETRTKTNRRLYTDNNNLTELSLPEGFNSHLYCHKNKLTELVLPEGFNSYLIMD